VWRDTTPRSLAQVADALGKLAQLLDVPPRALWEKIPGVTETDIRRWEAMADDRDALGDINQLLALPPAGAEQPVVPGAEEAQNAEPAGGSPDATVPAAGPERS
jgi:hypothetical protein